MDPSHLEEVTISDVKDTSTLDELNKIPENVVKNGITHPGLDPDESVPVIYDILVEKTQDLSAGSDFSEVIDRVDTLQSDHEERYSFCKTTWIQVLLNKNFLLVQV